MINKKNHYIAISCTLVIVSSLGLSAKFHEANYNKNLDKTIATLESNKTDTDVNTVQKETSKVEQEAEDSKKIEIISYTVKTGDTIETISKLYEVNAATISESNGIAFNAVLLEGQVLKFPSIDGVVHKVGNNETLWDIAATYKKDVDELIKTNSLEAPDKLKINQNIIIPGVEKILAVKISSDENLVAKAEGNKKVLSRGGSIPTETKAISSQVKWPIRGSVSSGFGTRNGRMHTGIDIAAPIGSTITAALDGKVIFNGWQDGYGKLIIIQHNNGLQTYYAHNSENSVKVGESVVAGQAIGKVGMTGRTTGPHVHFEVRKSGNPDNPIKYLS